MKKEPLIAASSIALLLTAVPVRPVAGQGSVTPGGFAGVSGAQRPSDADVSQGPTFKAYTDLVAVHAAVLDKKSRFVRGLPRDRFSIYEDGVAQTVRFFSNDDRAASIGLVIDNSGSMQNKREQVITAALAFAQASNPLDEFFVVHFNERVWTGLPEGTSFTSSPPILANALSHVEAYGRTALYDAIARGLEHLNEARNPHRVLVVISDGGDNASATRFEPLLRRAQLSDVVIYTIGLFDENTPDRNPRILKELAATTGGEAFLPGSINGAVKVLDRIAHDIRSAYQFGYEPANNARDGMYRTVRVELDGAGRGTHKVRARTGYFVPAAGSE